MYPSKEDSFKAQQEQAAAAHAELARQLSDQLRAQDEVTREAAAAAAAARAERAAADAAAAEERRGLVAAHKAELKEALAAQAAEWEGKLAAQEAALCLGAAPTGGGQRLMSEAERREVGFGAGFMTSGSFTMRSSGEFQYKSVFGF